MIDLAVIKARLTKAWDSGQLLSEWLRGEERWPFAIACRAPSGGDLLKRYTEVQAWIARLEEESDQGRLYRIEHEARRLQKLGVQRLPNRIWIDSREQALGLIGKSGEFDRFAAIVQETEARKAALRGWLLQKPLLAIAYAEDWSRLLDLCDWFQAHPQPKVYMRQIDLPGIDSKFIEARMAILNELLDILLPREAVDTAVTASSQQRFAQRYGLKYDEAFVRLRLLDCKLIEHYRGISDLRMPFSEFQHLSPPCERVFITENKINGLAFPAATDAIVIFGLGYGVEALQTVAWLSEKQIIYWGDIDTHGYHILSRLREYLPNTKSLLMDESDVQRFIKLAVTEPEESHNPQMPERLYTGEAAAFMALCENRYEVRVRIEQERLPYAALREAISKLEVGPNFGGY